MCGIVGYVGNKEKTLPVLIEGLQRLEYRGYDSAGIAYLVDDNIKLVKAVGKIKNLEELVDFSVESPIGIGHTRWATHGKPSIYNSHPHQVGDITLVHNGIIDNDKELKQFLINQGYSFYSETDTEVVASLIDYFYKEKNDIKVALLEMMKIVRGSYALGIMVRDIKGTLYAVRKDSPLVIGRMDKEYFIASDYSAIATDEVYYLKEGLIAEISNDAICVYDQELKEVSFDWQLEDKNRKLVSKEGYDHFMLKEIYEQPRVLHDTIYPYLCNGVDSLLERLPDFTKYEQIHIVGCGSAYHTGVIGKKFIEEIAHVPVMICIASEYRYQKIFFNDKTLLIAVSQSGETADTLAALKKAKENGCDVCAIVNVKNSSIAREADYVLNTLAGSEVAVATTKAYLAQVAMFILITLGMALQKNVMKKDKVVSLIDEFMGLHLQLADYLKGCSFKEIAQDIFKHDNIFFIGRGIDYALCLEGSLKLKEISYIHSEAYAAGELKHGTISLIEQDMPVIALVTDASIADKTISNIEEVKSRGASVTLITTTELDSNHLNYPNKVLVPTVSPLFEPLFVIIPLQLISYEVAKLRGCDIDKPKNLAKSVTVE